MVRRAGVPPSTALVRRRRAPRCRFHARARGTTDSRTRGTARMASSNRKVVRDVRRIEEPREHAVEGQDRDEPGGGAGHERAIAEQPAVDESGMAIQAAAHIFSADQDGRVSRAQALKSADPRRPRLVARNRPSGQIMTRDDRRKQHARLDEPCAARQADQQPLHELLPGRWPGVPGDQERKDPRAGRADQLGPSDVTRATTTDQVPDTVSPSGMAMSTSTHAKSVLADRHPQLRGDERRGGQGPRRRCRGSGRRLGSHRGSSWPTVTATKAGQEGRGQQHADQGDEGRGRPARGGPRRAAGSSKNSRMAVQRRQRPPVLPPFEPRLGAGGEEKALARAGKDVGDPAEPQRTLPANRARRRDAPGPRRTRRRDTRGEAGAPGSRPSGTRGLRTRWPGRRPRRAWSATTRPRSRAARASRKASTSTPASRRGTPRPAAPARSGAARAPDGQRSREGSSTSHRAAMAAAP